MNSSEKTFLKQPYPGLRPFTREESYLFFGREEQSDRLLERLGGNRFISVIGLSGCGKSSLVRAGMIPALECGYLSSAGAQWRIATMRPGRHPRRRFAEALLEETALGFELLPLLGKKNIAEAVPLVQAGLRRGPLGLQELFRQTPLPKSSNLLVIVDQFEELFRYHQHDNENEAEAFVALLVESARQKDVPIYIVITMRSEFVGHCSLFSGLAEQVNDGQFLIPRLSREQQHQAIKEPAKVFNGEVEPRLVNTLLNEMGNNPDRLPLLQHCLMRMWQIRQQGSDTQQAGLTLTLEDYEAVGGLQNALSNHADEAFDELNPQQQQMAKSLFCALADLEQRDVRHPSPLQEIAEIANASEAEVTVVADAFRRADRCFLTPAADRELESGSILDVSHESLLRQWKQLAGWLQAEKRSIDFYAYLEQAARRWKQGTGKLWDAAEVESFEREEITKKWARRYGEHFELCMEFIAASQEAAEEEERRKERAQQKELETQRQLAEAAQARQHAEEQARREAEQRAAEQKRAATRLRWFTLGLVLACFLMAGIARWAWKAQKEAVEHRNLALAAQEKAERSLSRQLIVQAEVALEQSPQKSLLLMTEALKKTQNHKQQPMREAKELLKKVLQSHGMFGLDKHADAVRDIAISPDNRWVITGSDDKKVRRWNLQSSDPGRRFDELVSLSSPVTRVLVSPDGNWIAATSEGGRVALVDLRSFNSAEPLSYNLEGRPSGLFGSGLTISSDSRWLISSDETRTILWNLKVKNPGEDSLPLNGHKLPDWRTKSNLSSSGRWLVTRHRNDLGRLWDLSALDPVSGLPAFVNLSGHKETISLVAFSHDDRWLVTGSRDAEARLWSLDFIGKDIDARQLSGHEGGVRSMAISPDSHWLVTVSRGNGTVRLWDLKAVDPTIANLLSTTDADGFSAISAQFSPNNSWLVVGGDSGNLRLYSGPDFLNSDVKTLRAHSGSVYGLDFTPDENWLVTYDWGGNGTLYLWDLTAVNIHETRRLLREMGGAFFRAAISEDSRWLATSSQSTSAWLWRLDQLRSKNSKELKADSIEEFLESACKEAGRNLYPEEWEQYLPGEEYRKTCADLPIPAPLHGNEGKND